MRLVVPRSRSACTLVSVRKFETPRDDVGKTGPGGREEAKEEERVDTTKMTALPSATSPTPLPSRASARLEQHMAGNFAKIDRHYHHHHRHRRLLRGRVSQLHVWPKRGAGAGRRLRTMEEGEKRVGGGEGQNVLSDFCVVAGKAGVAILRRAVGSDLLPETGADCADFFLACLLLLDEDSW